jgi:hypothetical protein
VVEAVEAKKETLHRENSSWESSLFCLYRLYHPLPSLYQVFLLQFKVFLITWYRMEQELLEFDKKCKKPLPPVLVAWRKRWVKAIERERAKRHENIPMLR